MKRQKIIAGNWKMNNNTAQTKEYFNSLLPKINNPTCKIILAVPYTSLCTAVDLTRNSPITICAQNCHYKANGAYTGEISADMLKEINVTYTLIGHSERREYFGETDSTVNAKLVFALESGITPILCIGETLGQREAEETQAVLKPQLTYALENIDASSAKNIIIAYEPVWAIGTGKTATGEQAEEACAYIRDCVAKLYDSDFAQKISILYGGSMNEKNCDELLSKANIDGGLIGGASLKPETFAMMIETGNKF